MSARTGCQVPTFTTGPEAADLRTAEEAIQLAEAAGVILLPWQAEQVRRALGQTEDQEWAASRFGLCVPRQNGKGVVLECVVLAKVLLLGERVLWTAHEVRTMQESFQRFRALLDGTPALAGLVRTVRTANGQESIRLTNGAEVKFSARSKSATRGLGFRTIVCDEAQELDYLTLGAMMPTLSGQGAARTQLLLTGTAPYSAKGEVFTDTRAAAYEGGDRRLAWAEWSCEREDRTDDVDVWARNNPSLGSIVRESKVVDELAALASRPEVFRRERLGEWGRSGEVMLALDERGWTASAGPRASWPDRDPRYLRRQEPVRFVGVDSTFNDEHAVLVEAVPLGRGVLGLDVLAAGPGLDWVAASIERMSGHVVVAFDPLRIGDLSPDLSDAGIRNGHGARGRRVVAASSRDLTLACDGLVRAVREERVRHDDPRLDAAAACATRSTFDDGKGWKLVPTGGGDVSTLIAGALALHALRTYPARTSDGAGQAVFV